MACCQRTTISRCELPDALRHYGAVALFAALVPSRLPSRCFSVVPSWLYGCMELVFNGPLCWLASQGQFAHFSARLWTLCALTHVYGPSVLTSTARAEFASANLTKVYGRQSLRQMNKTTSGHEGTQLPISNSKLERSLRASREKYVKFILNVLSQNHTTNV